jgi:FkbM family methyltransferase
MTVFQKIPRRLLYRFRAWRLRHFPFRDCRIKTEFGFRLLLDMKKDVDRLFYLGQFESQTLHFFRNVIARDAVVFDVGANIGIYSLLAGTRAGVGGHVYSFEPSDWAFQRLTENIRINDCKNISVFKQGISDTSGTAEFHVCEDDAYNSLGDSPMCAVKETKTIKIQAIDDFCEINGITAIDVIKIDTEGADLLALQGAKRMLQSRRPPIIFCEYNRVVAHCFNFTLEDFRLFLSSNRYRIFEVSNDALIDFDPVHSTSSEIICIHETRLEQFPSLKK